MSFALSSDSIIWRQEARVSLLTMERGNEEGTNHLEVVESNAGDERTPIDRVSLVRRKASEVEEQLSSRRAHARSPDLHPVLDRLGPIDSDFHGLAHELRVRLAENGFEEARVR